MPENFEILGSILTGINEIKHDIGRIESKLEINYDEMVIVRRSFADHASSFSAHGMLSSQDQHNRLRDYFSVIFAAASLCLSIYYAYNVSRGGPHVNSHQADIKK